MLCASWRSTTVRVVRALGCTKRIVGRQKSMAAVGQGEAPSGSAKGSATTAEAMELAALQHFKGVVRDIDCAVTLGQGTVCVCSNTIETEGCARLQPNENRELMFHKQPRSAPQRRTRQTTKGGVLWCNSLAYYCSSRCARCSSKMRWRWRGIKFRRTSIKCFLLH
jgi:hypothetical protein